MMSIEFFKLVVLIEIKIVNKVAKKYFVLGLLAILFFSCKREVSAPSYDDGSISVSFPKMQKDFFRLVKNSFDKKTGIQYTEYMPIGGHPNFVIAKESNHFVYSQLQKGIRSVCPPGIITGNNKKFKTFPTHTEVLNDTTFLLGQMWFEYDGTDKLETNVKGSNGWVASIIRPQSVIFVNIWFEDRSIHVDSLLFWSLSVREELIVDFPDFSLGLGMF